MILENERVRLSPLTKENQKELWPIAQEPGLVKYSPAQVETPEGLKQYLKKAETQRYKGTAIPFLVYDKDRRAFAGTTRFMNIDPINKVVHIGATWLGRDFHGTGLNKAMKTVMLHHAFGTMNMEKVEFRIDERNKASRKAVEKLGAHLEGILRENVYLSDGFKRNTCCYGILKREWELR